MKRVKSSIFCISFSLVVFLSLSFLEKPRSPQRDAEEVHGRRDYREE